MKVAIIGGGLAGCSLAYSLKLEGLEPVVYEAGASVGAGASGNYIGLYNPRFSAHKTEESDFTVAAYALALRNFSAFKDIDWNPKGALHLMNDDQKAKRFPQTVKNWRWEPEHMRIVSAKEASDIAGLEVHSRALYLPDSGGVSPRKLCDFYTRDVEVHLHYVVKDIDAFKEEVGASIVVVASAYNAVEYYDWLPLQPVRGQITYVQATEHSQKLQCFLCYGGYFSPANEHDIHVVGSTFQRGLNLNAVVVDEDDRENIAKLAAVLPELAEGLEVVDRRAATRTSVKGHFPIVGSVPGREDVYLSVGYGSHGVISSHMGAHLLNDMIMKRPLCLPKRTVEALSPHRFYKA